MRVLPGGHYGDNTWEERGVLTEYDDDGGSPGGDASASRRQLDLDEIRAESRRLVAGLKSVYDGKSAETFSPPSRTLALPVLIEPELLAGRAGPRLIAGQVRMRPPLGATVASFQCEVGRPSAARGDSREWSVHDCTVPAAEVAALRGGSATIRFESNIGAKLLGGAIVVRVRARGFADAVSLATPWSGTSEAFEMPMPRLEPPAAIHAELAPPPPLSTGYAPAVGVAAAVGAWGAPAVAVAWEAPVTAEGVSDMALAVSAYHLERAPAAPTASANGTASPSRIRRRRGTS